LTDSYAGSISDSLHSGLKFHVSNHFAIRIAERGISCESAKDVVKYADSEKKLQKGNHGGNLCIFTKSVEGSKLIVVAEIKNNECWLTTAYYEA
jgi:Domain of unknown function (DUF4258)